MKRLLTVTALITLSGCSTIASLWPRDHDPVMFDRAISIQIQMNKVNCSNKEWGNLIDNIHHLKVYTEVRKDPQATNIAQLEEATLKAYNSKNEKFCESILNLNKTRIQVIEDAWRGR